MTQQALDEIISMVLAFKDKQRDVKERLLTYFEQIRKHQEVALSNHYKILFEFISEVQSSHLHVQVLAQVHKHIDKDLIGPKDFKVIIEYFKCLIVLSKDKLYLKIAELTLSMIDKIDKTNLPTLKQMVEVVSMMRLAPNAIPETVQQCTDQLVKHFQEFSKSHNTVVCINFEFLVRQICQEFTAHNQNHSDYETVYDQTLIITLLEALIFVEDSIPQRSQQLCLFIYEMISRKHQQVDSDPSTRKLCLNLLVTMGNLLPNRLDSLAHLILVFSKQTPRNHEFALKLLKQIYSKPNLPVSIYHSAKQICPQVYGLLENVQSFTNNSTLPVAILSTLSNILQSVTQSSLSGEDQLDWTRSILNWVNPSMKLIRKRMPSGAVLMAWTELFHLMIKRAFHYRIQTNLVLKLTKYDHDLFVDTIEKYDSYFAEEEYWAVYHIIFRQGFNDIYDGPVDKLEMHISGLKKVLIDSLTRNNIEESQFAIKTIKSLLSRHPSQVKMIIRRIQQVCNIVFDKGNASGIDSLLNMISSFIKERSELDMWVYMLKVCQPETLEVKFKILDIINELVQNYGQHLSESCWTSLIPMVGVLSNELNEEYLRQVLTILEIIIQQYLYLFNDDLIGKCLDCLVCYPFDSKSKNTKDKYKICGLLWTLGEKKRDIVIERVADRLEEFCYDEVPEVAINGLCVYSELGTYQGYERLSKRLLKSGKENVIISYLHNYVKMVKRTLSQQIYHQINEFVVNNLPQLYELGLNEVIIQSTICHHQLARLTVKEILADPEYFQLSLYFFINFLSEKPKDLRLVRYSIPKMMVELLSEMTFLSTFPMLSESILFKDCLELISRIVAYPALTNSAFNLEKNKIYFEDTQIEKYVDQFYMNLKNRKEMMTPILTKISINRPSLIDHTRYVTTSRLDWLKRLGKPRDRQDLKTYSKLFDSAEEIKYISESDWGLIDYLSVQGKADEKFYKNIILKLEAEDRVDISIFRLVYEDSEDSQEVIARKASLALALFDTITRVLRLQTTDDQEKLKIIDQLLLLSIHPHTFHLKKQQLRTELLTSNRAHLVYFSSIVSQIGIQSDNKQLKDRICAMLAQVGRQLQLPIS